MQRLLSLNNSSQGDIMYLNVLGQPIVMLSSQKAIEDLIVKKSSIFLGRGYRPMAYDL